MNQKKYQCPCCGFYTLEEPGGSFEICPVCYWEADAVQNENPDDAGGANRLSLNESRRNYQRFGACEEQFLQYVREPLPEEKIPEQAKREERKSEGEK